MPKFSYKGGQGTCLVVCSCKCVVVGSAYKFNFCVWFAVTTAQEDWNIVIKIIFKLTVILTIAVIRLPTTYWLTNINKYINK